MGAIDPAMLGITSGTTPALTTTTPPTTTTTTTTTSTTTTTTPTTTTTTTTTPQPTTTTTTTTTPQPTTTTTTTTTQAPTTPPPDDDSCNVCPINCVLDSRCPLFNPSKPVLLPHSECTKFYKCETGRACELECPAGLHFNAAKMVCDWPWHACCDPNVECVIPCIPGVTCPPTLG
ncbi:integumentary mucin C.1-like [Sabethes cyaneus]|uniref:integumentary mucin C.1-like n=1 Tax=Sabethes cyaneus TaxID=53552 RepID=UPI00237DD3A2|nr:integumentary mucin C.1-like [Sabethes cyaneus]